MNIFFLSRNPKHAAKYHADVHVIKMILETAQLLFTAHHLTQPDDSWSRDLPFKVYKVTHQNHPCAKWVRESQHNYYWAAALGISLCREYTLRYGKVHATQPALVWLIANMPPIPNIGMTEPPQAMPDEYKKSDSVDAYRTYYRESKSKLSRFGYKLGKPKEVESWLP